MGSNQVILSFLVAVLLGFLIGLERERKRETHGSIFAGIRTFPLIALFGAIIGILTVSNGPWILVGSFAPIALLVGLAYWRESKGEKVGGTTEMAVLVAFGLGVIAGMGDYVGALAGAVLATTVLSLRPQLRHLAGAITPEDLYAIVQFAVVSLVILPIIPSENFGPWGVWNPRTIWLQVVLISGLSFVGYIATKLVGSTRGISLSGLLGGLASSTAVTISFSERSKAAPALELVYASGVLAASAVMVPRILVLLGIVEPSLVLPTLVSLGVLMVLSAVGSLIVLRFRGAGSSDGAKVANPFELKVALQFALLFALILLVAKAAEVYLGTGGIYLASALAGLTKPDAMALTLANQMRGGLDVTVAVRGLAIAVVSNSVFKGVLAMSLGGKRFGRAVLVTLVIAGAASLAAAFLLPPL